MKPASKKLGIPTILPQFVISAADVDDSVLERQIQETLDEMRPKYGLQHVSRMVEALHNFNALDAAVDRSDCALIRLHLSRGEGSFLQQAMRTTEPGRARELRDRMVHAVVDRVVRAHDADYSVGLVDSMRAQEMLRLFATQFPFLRTLLLLQLHRARYQVTERSDVGIADALRCIEPNPAEDRLHMQALLSAAVMCHWTRTQDCLVNEYRIALDQMSAFHALQAGATALLRVLRVAATPMSDGSRHPRLAMVQYDNGYVHTRCTLFRKMFGALRDGAWFVERRWFVANGVPENVLSALEAYGVDPLELGEAEGQSPRVFLETVACPRLLENIQRAHTWARRERDRLVLGARYLWCMCAELLVLEERRWMACAVAVMMAAHPRLGRGSPLAQIDLACLSQMIANANRPAPLSEEMGARIAGLRVLVVGSGSTPEQADGAEAGEV